jgi:two-component system chemotaxis response regulator CheY
MEQPCVKTTSGTFRCLVADDSEFARMNIGKIVSVAGGEVVGEARNGMEAVEMYARLNPDLVLLDITMPELGGLDALRKIIKNDKEAKVIIVSSLGNRDMVWKAICLGAKHFITKPFSPGYAESVIEGVVRRGEVKKDAL